MCVYASTRSGTRREGRPSRRADPGTSLTIYFRHCCLWSNYQGPVRVRLLSCVCLCCDYRRSRCIDELSELSNIQLPKDSGRRPPISRIVWVYSRSESNFVRGLHNLLVQSTANDTVQLKAVCLTFCFISRLYDCASKRAWPSTCTTVLETPRAQKCAVGTPPSTHIRITSISTNFSFFRPPRN